MKNQLYKGENYRRIAAILIIFFGIPLFWSSKVDAFDRTQDLLNGVDVRGKDLSRMDFTRASLVLVDLSEANLKSARLGKTDLRSACLSRTNLGAAKLWYADLRRANLRGADLSGAILRGANFASADLWGAKLNGADLRYANLIGARNLEVDQLSKAASLFGAKLEEEKREALMKRFPHLFEKDSNE